MRRILVLWLLLLVAACGPPTVAGPGQPRAAGTPIRIVTPTPVFQATPILAHPPTAPPPDYTPPTPAPTAPLGYVPPVAPTAVLQTTYLPPSGPSPTLLPSTHTPGPQRPTPPIATPYPLPPTATLAPSAQPGRLLFSFPWPNSGANAAPPGIAIGHDGNILLSDVMRPGLYRYTPDGQPLGRWDIPSLPNTPPPGAGPHTLAVAGDGSLYVPVVDGMQRLAPDGRPLTPWPSSPPVSALSLAVGPDTTVYTIDSARSQVSRFTADGAPLGAWNGSRPDQPFRAAQAVAVGLDGRVYVADWATSSIYLFASDGSPVGDWVGAPSGTGELYTPVALTIAPDSSLFVLEGRRRRVSRFDPAGRLIEWWDGPADGDRPFSPYALAVSADRAYIVDVANQRVQVYGYTPLGRPVPTLAATPPPPPR